MNTRVYIEIGRINTLNVSDSVIDQLAAIDQAESHFRSENIKFGIRHLMRSGKTMLNHTQFLGYTKGRMASCKLCRKKLGLFTKSLTPISMAMEYAKSNGIWRNTEMKGFKLLPALPVLAMSVVVHIFEIAR